MTLQEPPKQQRAAGILGRFLGLLLLLGAFALVVWTAATLEQIGALERSDPFVHAPGEHVSVGSQMIHVRRFGEGAVTTVLIHPDEIGGGASLAPLARSLAEAGRSVLVPDLVGFGFSSRLSQPGRAVSTSGQAETLAGLIDQIGIDSIEVVGLGWGGEIATELAVTRSEVVSRLVLVDVAEIPYPLGDSAWLEALPFGVGKAFAHTFEGASDRAQERFVAQCPSWVVCADAQIREERRRASTIPGTADGIWARRATSPASVAADRLDQAIMPVDLIVVDADVEAVEELAARFPEAQVVPVAPDRLASAILG